MIVKAKKWGNSMGVIIPVEDVKKMDLKEGEELAIEVVKKGNPLKELFGAGKDNPITLAELKKARKELESKWFE